MPPRVTLNILAAAALVFADDLIAATRSNGVYHLTMRDFRLLAREALTPQQKRLPGLGLEIGPEEKGSRYVFFTVTWKGARNGSVVVDNLAVDRMTGDVWSATSACLEKRTEGLERLQADLRALMRMSAARYYRLKAHGPLCES